MRTPTAANWSSPTSGPATGTRIRQRKLWTLGFLELVRFGIRKAGDPLIEESLKVVDAVLEGGHTEGALLEALQS